MTVNIQQRTEQNAPVQSDRLLKNKTLPTRPSWAYVFLKEPPSDRLPVPYFQYVPMPY